MFIGEAPGRRGADGSGIPFHGDRAGHNFESLISQVGLDRNNIFVTNAVLCNPKDDKGNNAPPNKTEIKNCSDYLRQQIELLDPKIVVTLGGTALNATASIEPHYLSLRENVRSAHKWFKRLLIPAYHPGQRAMIHRSFPNQLSDYQFIAEQLNRFGKKGRKVKGSVRTDALVVVKEIARLKPKLSYFSLHKLFYLVEYKAVQELGHRLTQAFIVRQKDGPYCTDLHLTKLKNSFSNLKIIEPKGDIIFYHQSAGLFDGKDNDLEKEAMSVINEVMEEYGEDDDFRLKSRVYTTGPLRWMLKAEKKGLNLFNAPIDFSKKSNSPVN